CGRGGGGVRRGHGEGLQGEAGHGGRGGAEPRSCGGGVGGTLMCAAAEYMLMPFKGAPDLQVEGAPEPAAAAERAIGDSAGSYQGFGAVLVDGDGSAEAFGGTADGTAPIGVDTPFETGSVWKAFRAMTLAAVGES